MVREHCRNSLSRWLPYYIIIIIIIIIDYIILYCTLCQDGNCDVAVRTIYTVLCDFMCAQCQSHTAIQDFDCGSEAAREFNRKSIHLNFVRLLLTKS